MTLFLRWLRLIPLDILSTLGCYLLAPFVVPFASDGRLPTWFRWMETHDNPLDGDAGWQNEHWQWRKRLPEPLRTYLGRVGWLWRNPAYRFAHEVLGGLIVQWGNIASVGGGAIVTVTLPIAFPNAVLNGQATASGNSTTAASAWRDNVTTTQFTIRSDGAANSAIYWLAIGY